MRRLMTIPVLIACLLVLGVGVAAAGEGAVGGSNDGDEAEATVGTTIPGAAGGGGGGSNEGPLCHYEDLMYTTQDEQRNEIRPEETRPGVWDWWVCDDGTSPSPAASASAARSAPSSRPPRSPSP